MPAGTSPSPTAGGAAPSASGLAGRVEAGYAGAAFVAALVGLFI
jgi:hypothetical protein